MLAPTDAPACAVSNAVRCAHVPGDVAVSGAAGRMRSPCAFPTQAKSICNARVPLLQCRSIGIHCRVLRLPDNVSQADLQACVSEVSADRAIDGVLVQLPLPSHLDEEAVMEALDPRKDVDGFHPLNMG